MIDAMAMLLQADPPAPAESPAVPAWQAAAVAVAALGATVALWRFRLLRPAQEPSGRLPRDPALGALAMMGFIVVGALGVTAGASLSTALGIADDAWSRLVRGSCANALQLAVVLPLIASALFVAAPRPRAGLGRALGEGVLGILLAAPIVVAVAMALQLGLQALGMPPAPDVSHETLGILRAKNDALFTALTLAQTAVLVPLAEEAGWRGLMQPAMRRAGLPALASAFVTAILFAAVHWTVIAPEGRITAMAMLLLLGTAFGILRERTGGILAPAVAHGLFNAANVALAMA